MIACMLFIHSASSQGLMLHAYYEQTQVSPKIGASIGVELWDRSEIGVFGQKKVFFEEGSIDTESGVEHQFFGLYASYPLHADELLLLKASARVGLANMDLWRVTPSVQATFLPNKPMSFGTALSMLQAKPTLMAFVKIRLARPIQSACPAVYN